MLHIKISGETPKSGKAICTSCKYAKMATGQNCEERIICSGGIFDTSRGLVTIKVAQCSQYHPMNMAWKYEMEQMAWIVQARKRGPTGFSKPEDGTMEVTIKPPNSGGSPEATSDGE